jgi:DNA adenine methylase
MTVAFRFPSELPAVITSPEKVSPFLKWAGAKRWMAKQMAEIIGPVKGVYYEPFLGSGAVFFALNPRRAYLSDWNPNLINAYIGVRDDAARIQTLLLQHHEKHSTDYYYEMRDAQFHNDVERAAQFIYLNRTCFNGIYRVNMSGKFNVPIGTRTSVVREGDDFPKVRSRLLRATLTKADFAMSLYGVSHGDVVFADPPYTLSEIDKGFIGYDKEGFDWEKQVWLKDALVLASRNGARVYMTNGSHPQIRDLYERTGFHIYEINRTSAIAASPAKRKTYGEVLVSNTVISDAHIESLRTAKRTKLED